MRKTLATIALCLVAAPLVACSPATRTTHTDGLTNQIAAVTNTNTQDNGAATDTSTDATQNASSNTVGAASGLGSTTGSTTHTTQTTTTTVVKMPRVSTPASTSKPFSQMGAAGVSSVSFINAKTGFVAGKDGIYRSDDGGKTWARVYQSDVPILGLQAKTPGMGNIINVVAYTKSYLLRSTDGRHFTKAFVGGNSNGSGANIQGISLLGDAMLWVLNDGVVWATNGYDGSLSKGTITGANSIAAVDENTCYAATSSAVYKTLDHGQHWTKVFSAPVANLPWKTQMEADGNHVAVIYYGGDAGMSQEAYILFSSNDGGKTWTAVADEGYFSNDYKDTKPVSDVDIGEQPGPFVMLPTGDIIIAGFDENDGSITIATTMTSNGASTSRTPVGPSANSRNVFDFPSTPLGICATDKRHIWIVGSKGGKGVVEMSTDGIQWDPS